MTSKNFNIVYAPNDKDQRCIISLPNQLNKLVPPLNIDREQQEEIDDSSKIPKRKTEAVEIEDEYYIRLKNKEKMPLLITDAEQRVFSGMLQDNSTGENFQQSNYFVLINAGNCFRLWPIRFWYRFSMRTLSELTLEEAEQRMKQKINVFENKKRQKKEDKEIDYEEKFDDDSDNDVFVEEEHETELNETGEALQKLMKNYEDESTDETEPDKDVIKANDPAENIGSLKRKSERKNNDSKKFNNSKGYK